MRILNVTETYSPFLEFGGPPVKVRALAEGLARRGHEVSVLTADWGFEKRMPAAGEKSGAVRSPFGWRNEENGVKTTYLPTWFRYRTVTWNPAVKRYCRARLQNFDMVHIFGLYDLLGPAVGAACQSRKLPYVVEPIGMFIPIVRNFWMKQAYHAFLGKPLLSGASALVATSEQEVLELISGGVPREKIVLRRNGVDVPRQTPTHVSLRTAFSIPQDAKIVLFLGRLSQKKSPDLLVRAFAQLPDQFQGQPLHLLIAGPDEDGQKAYLTQLTGELQISPRVHFCGPLFGDAKWAAYREAEIFVLPSQNENFGNTAAEAIAAGTPAMVTEQCGIAPWIAGKAGMVVAHDASALAGALTKVLSNPEFRSTLASGCSAVTAELGWDQPVVKMEALYGKLIEEGGKR